MVCTIHGNQVLASVDVMKPIILRLSQSEQRPKGINLLLKADTHAMVCVNRMRFNTSYLLYSVAMRFTSTGPTGVVSLRSYQIALGSRTPEASTWDCRNICKGVERAGPPWCRCKYLRCIGLWRILQAESGAGKDHAKPVEV